MLLDNQPNINNVFVYRMEYWLIWLIDPLPKCTIVIIMAGDGFVYDMPHIQYIFWFAIWLLGKWFSRTGGRGEDRISDVTRFIPRERLLRKVVWGLFRNENKGRWRSRHFAQRRTNAAKSCGDHDHATFSPGLLPPDVVDDSPLAACKSQHLNWCAIFLVHDSSLARKFVMCCISYSARNGVSV